MARHTTRPLVRSVYKPNPLTFLTLLLTLLLVLTLQIPSAAAAENGKSTADHSKFTELSGPFSSGPDVTKACLKCHTEAAKQIHKTKHWTWEFTHPKTGQKLGKKNVINNFCGAVPSNEKFCSKCHVGYGWEDDSFDFASEENVDCVVCHDTTGTYLKFPGKAGHPLYEPAVWKGRKIQPPDLTKIAKNVGPTSRDTCGSCHFTGGGGNAVKHGDLDMSMKNPGPYLDVHMSPEGKGLNFTCSTCHNADGHAVPGSRYDPKATDSRGVVVPGKSDQARSTCQSCHSERPHGDNAAQIDEHTDKIACQTCHIPRAARGGFATKTVWDWSTSTKHIGESGKKIHKYDEKGREIYRTGKGHFEWDEFIVPQYRWFNGGMEYTLLGDKVEDGQKIGINKISGSAKDPGSRIWPFKVMRGKQAIDAGNKTLAVVHLWGGKEDKDALWSNFNWEKAIAAGMKAKGREFSGKVGFVETEMVWPLTHMVAPKEDALSCEDCHSRSGRMAGIEGIYMPGRDRLAMMDLAGFGIAFLALLGMISHGGLRIYTHYQEKNREN